MSNRTCSVSDCPTDMTGKYLRKSYCEKHYYSWRKYGTPTPTSHQRRAARKGYNPEPGNCVQCSTEFLRTNHNSKYCSDICRSWAAFLGPGKSKHCSDCGDPMTASRSSKTGPGRCAGCSQHGFGGYDRGCRCDICRETVNSWSREYNRKHFEATGEWLNGAWIKREARLKLYERDGWICQICFETVNKGAWSADPLDPTLDHIVPRSKGGGHEPENLRTAHWVCNGRRGDRTE